MSEYQYYEFQAIDKPLSTQEKRVLGQLSSRVKLSSTKSVFSYSYGDFPGNPKQVLSEYFDAMFYIANWGTMQLMFRLPQSLVNLEAIEPYCLEDCLSVETCGDYVIIELFFDDQEGFGWIEGEGYLETLVKLRQELLEQDYRVLYLAWLKAISWEELDEQQDEPPVPDGLSQLSAPLSAFAELWQINPYLIQVAARDSTKPPSVSDHSFKLAIQKLSRDECESFLMRLAQGEANLNVTLKQRLHAILNNTSLHNTPQRTIKQLLADAQQQERRVKLEQKQQAEIHRRKELESLVNQEDYLWQQVDSLIAKKQVKPYEEAVQILVNLQDLASYQHKQDAFSLQMQRIYKQYSRLSGLLRRLRKAGLYP